jgi:HAD superfamily hydrolase (TIGR01458 family)
MGIEGIDGLLLDIDGVLAVSWEPIPGSVEAIEWIRAHDLPFRLITNTTTHPRRELASTLGSAGFDVRPDEIVTAVVATATYLRATHPEAPTFVLTDGDPSADLEEVVIVDRPEDADVVVVGGASEDFSYDAVNRVFRRLMDGAALVGMHRNRYWRTAQGLQLDAGAFIAGLEYASGVAATICGKPAAEYFHAALEPLGVPASRALMVGDDIENDVMGAQAAGLTGVLVRTGKFRAEDLERGRPDHVLDSLGDLPGLIGDRRRI